MIRYLLKILHLHTLCIETSKAQQPLHCKMIQRSLIFCKLCWMLMMRCLTVYSICFLSDKDPTGQTTMLYMMPWVQSARVHVTIYI